MMFLYRSFFPLFFFFALIIGFIFSKKFRLGLRLRREKLKPSLIPYLNESFWIHAASGEYEYAKPLIKELKSKYPQIPIVVTYFSPSYQKAIESDSLVDHSFPLPFDLPGPTRSFIKKINPKAFFIARTDLWPELLFQLKQRKIPRILFSHFEKDMGSCSPAKSFKHWLLKQCDHIDCVNEISARRLSHLASSKRGITCFGDTRFDRVIERKKHPKTIPFQIRQRNVLVLGSTWRQDEEVLVRALELTKSKWDLAIVAPHEPTKSHIRQLERIFCKHGFHTSLFSKVSGDLKSPILIVDQVGWLFDLYRYGSLGFVGGSFRKSVHSVMEPLSQGLKVFLGPHYKNNGEAEHFLNQSFKQQAFLTVAHNAQEVALVISGFFSLLNDEQKQFKSALIQEVEGLSGASHKLIQHLEERKLY